MLDFVIKCFRGFLRPRGHRKLSVPPLCSLHFEKSVLSLGTLDLSSHFSVQNFTNIFDKIH